MDGTMHIPMITGHSGCEETPRDSLDSIDAALQYGPDAVEMDVRLAEDGVLRVSHDAVSLSDYSKKPTLEQVFARVSETGMKLNCDIKSAPALYFVLDMAGRYGFQADRLILSGCLSPEQLVRDVAILRRATVFMNIEEIFKFFYLSEHTVVSPSEFSGLMNAPWDYLRRVPISLEWFERAARFASELQVSAVNLPHRLLNDDVAAIFAAWNVPLSVWTVNAADTLDYCLKKHVLNITTLNVARACAQRKSTFGC